MPFLGVISDTHGLVREAALDALAGSESIVHAGDVGKPEVLEALSRIAPVHAVRGDVDRGDWALSLPHDCVVDFAGVRIYVLHILAELNAAPAAAGYAAVVSGHSHKAHEETRDGVLYLNPGSAGPRRFRLPVTLARLHIENSRLRTELIDLSV